MYKEQLSSFGASKQSPKRVIVHAMGEYIKTNQGSIHAVDFLESIGLSAHVLVCPNGDIVRCRHDNQGGYHAKGYNKDSIGIEFLVKGEHDYSSFLASIETPYLTIDQYQAGMEFVRDEWRIKAGILRYSRHSDVSPERKVDPGSGFTWIQFLKDIGVII